MGNKLALLKSLKFGARVAEDEAEDLERYFVETDQWQQIRSGEIDVIYGPKGSGKSALYTLLNRKDGELFDDNVLLASGENIRGATVFSSLIADPPPSELAFIYLWKLYCLTLVAKSLRDYDINNDSAVTLIQSLEKAHLLPTSGALSVLFRAVSTYLRNWFRRDAQAIEYALTIDPSSGAPTVSRKTEFRAGSEEQNLDEIPVDELLHVANAALEEEGLSIWLLFDRLDVAFADSPEMERNALRALFRAYNDMKGYANIALKIFVRDDIWGRITEGGFTEASHITRTASVTWSEETLLNLVVLRLLNNPDLVDFLDIDVEVVQSDYSQQQKLLYRLVPDKVDSGKNPATFAWIISRTTDATGRPVPREVIHLLEEAKALQVQKIERGEKEPEAELLFDRSSIKEALPQVSKTRFEQTLLAEHADLRWYVQRLEGEKAEQSIGSLAKLWGSPEEKAAMIAVRLREIGFFEERGDKTNPSYWVPFLYRAALGLIQGKAT